MPGTMMEDVRVMTKPRERVYTAAYKRRIPKEADACTTPGRRVRCSGERSCTPATWWRDGGGGRPGARCGASSGR